MFLSPDADRADLNNHMFSVFKCCQMILKSQMFKQIEFFSARPCMGHFNTFNRDPFVKTKSLF